MRNKRGIQIISKRLTKLERELLKVSIEAPKGLKIIDLGGGDGDLSILLSFLNKRVFYYDLNPPIRLRIINLFLKNKIKINQKDISKLRYSELPDKIDIVYSSRVLHYLKYEELLELLKKIKTKMGNEAKLYINLTGLKTEIAKKYPCFSKKLENRFCFLEKEYQKRFEIYERVTLYSKEEVCEIFSKFFKIEEVWESEFGNIFLIGVRKD